MRTKTYKLYPG